MSKKWLIVLVGAIVALGVGAYFGLQQFGSEDGESALTEPTENILLETEVDLVNAEGRVVPVRQANLAYLSGGSVVEVIIQEGDLVEMGDTLLQLETTDQEIAIQQAEAVIYLAKADLAGAESILEQAQIGLLGAELAVRDSEADLALLETGATEAQITLSEQTVIVAEAGITQASGRRAAALEGASNAEIATAEAQLAVVRAEYDSIASTYLPILQDANASDIDRELAALRLNGAQAALNAAQANLDRLSTGATTSEQVAANSGVTTAVNQREVAQAQLDLLLAGALVEQITIAEAKLASTETAVAEAESRVSVAESAVAQAEAALSEAQSGLAIAENELAQRTLIAPFTGTIAAVNVKEGEIVQPGIPVIVLADFSQWQVETTDLTELDVVDVRQGSPVAVAIDAFPGLTLRGEVRTIAATAAEVRGDVTYATTIELVDSDDLPLRWGMTAFVKLLTDEAVDLADNTAEQAKPSNIQAEGQLVPRSFVNLAFSTPGRVQAIPVNKDDLVASNTPLIELETSEVQMALAQADARVMNAEAGVAAAKNQQALAEIAVAKAEDTVVIAQANLALVQAGPRPAEIAAAEATLAAADSAIIQANANRNIALDTISEADVSSAEANLAAANAELRVMQEAYQQILDSCFEAPDGQTVCPLYGTFEEEKRGQLEVAQAKQVAAQSLLDVLNAGPTNAQRSAAAGSVVLAVANRDLAQAQLDLLLADSSVEQIEKAQVAVDQAELGVLAAEAELDHAATTVAQAEAGLSAAEASRNAIQAELDKMTLLAVIAGNVTGLSPNPGEMVTPGIPVATVADMSGWLVETSNVSELDAPYITEGDSVEVRFDAIPDSVTHGVVTKIGNMPGMNLGDVVYKVTIQLEDAPDLPLRWGMTALVDVKVE